MTASERELERQQQTDSALEPRRKPRHRQWGGASFGLLLGVAGLVAGRLGQLYPIFDVFSQFGMQFIAMSAGFGIALFMVRYKSLIGFVLTAAFLLAYGLWPHLVSSPLQKGPYMLSPGEKLLRVAHFNTYKKNRNFQAIADEVLRLDADVVTLLEMQDEKKRELPALLRARYPHQSVCADVNCQMAIISKFPIVETGSQHAWEGPPYQRVVLGGEMAGIVVYAVHTIRFPHVHAHLAQVQALRKTLDAETGKVLVMGDFNTTPLSRVMRTLEQGNRLARLTELPTWPSFIQLPQLAIDHALASTEFRVVGNQQIGDAVGSDHYPIVLTLAFKP